MSYQYYASCVSWPENPHREGGLIDMIDSAIDITRRTLREAVGLDQLHQLERDLGYADNAMHGLTMGQDYHVSYHRSKLHGRRCYYVKHSAIEHVFVWE